MTWLSTMRDRNQSTKPYQLRRPAVAFRLYDQDSQLVNLRAYLNRHKIVLVFFDAQRSPMDNKAMKLLHEKRQQLTTADYQVFGISTALPQHNRAAVADHFPFPLLSDPTASQPGSVHRIWGCLREPDSRNSEASTVPSVFVIDRRGAVNWEGKYPLPIPLTDDFAQRLLDGEFD